LSGVTVQFDRFALSGVEKVITEAGAFGDDLTPLGPALYDEWFSPMEHEQFASEGGFSGGWSISESYAKAKADIYGNLPIEQLPDHKLLSSLTERTAEGAVYDVQPNSISFGSRLSYARRQHAQNPLIAITPEKLLSLEELVRREWRSFLTAAGLGDV
jgi:hypothetical protein